MVLVYPIPEIYFDPVKAITKFLTSDRDPAQLGITTSSYRQRQEAPFAILDRIRGDRIVRVYPHRRLCNSDHCMVYADGLSLYRDHHHLSPAGAEYLMPEIE